MNHDFCNYDAPGNAVCDCATCAHDCHECCMSHGKECDGSCPDYEKDPAFQSMNCEACSCDTECCDAMNCFRCFRAGYAEPGWRDYCEACEECKK